MSKPIVPGEGVSANGASADDLLADACQGVCCFSRRSWSLLLVLFAVLAVLVFWKRESWYALMTEGVLEESDSRQLPSVTQVRDVRDGFHPIVAVPRSFPPITDFPVASANDVQGPDAEFQIRDNELVLGISVGNESRAYPINMLTGPRREIINDTLGGIPIAATW